MNEQLMAEGKEPAEGTRAVLGITKAVGYELLPVRSILPGNDEGALADAAIKGRIDPLIGLKENVIIYQLIPRYRRSNAIATSSSIRMRRSRNARRKRKRLAKAAAEKSRNRP